MQYSEEQLFQLSQTNLNEFIKILNKSTTSNVELTFGAEILGTEIKDEKIVLPILKKLLNHLSSLVREGAIIGITSFYINIKPPAEILEKLQQMSKNDPSPTLKSYAKEVLEEYYQ